MTLTPPPVTQTSIKKPNIFKRFWYFITFKNHHNHLLTIGGSSYLTVTAVIVTLAALSEGFAWGHFGSTLTPDNPWIGRIGLGMFIFTLLWFFDRIMATQDIIADEHAKTLEGEPAPRPFLRFLPGNVKTWFIFAVRLAIVMGSLYITAPFLTHLVFASDIQAEIEKSYKAKIEYAKEEHLGKLDTEIKQTDALLPGLHERLQQEIGGKRGTGYGKGPVAESIENELKGIEQKLAALKDKREQTEKRLDQAVIDNDINALKTFGIIIDKDSPVFREEAKLKLAEKPAYHTTKLAVDSFLFGVGLILILAKLLQPKPLQMYYSARLQEAWQNYRTGLWDDYLFADEKSTAIPHDEPLPQKFEKIAIHYAQTNDARKKELDAEQAIKRAEKTKDQEMESFKNDLDRAKQKERWLKDKALADSQDAHAQHNAREAQNTAHASQTIGYQLKNIETAINTAEKERQRFVDKNSQRYYELLEKKERWQRELGDAQRFYESQDEDKQARLERLKNAQREEEKLQQIADELQQKENLTPEEVKSHTVAQNAVEKQKQVVNNMKNGFLSFERDMNFHQEKMQNLQTAIQQADEETENLAQRLGEFDTAIEDLVNQKMALQAEHIGDTPYIVGTEEEIPFIAEQMKINKTYHYSYYTPPKDDDDDNIQ